MLKKLLPTLLALPLALPAQTCPERYLGAPLGGGDEAVFDQPIGFAFPFAGTTYTDVHISTNGFFYLSNAGTPAPGGADYTSTPAELANLSPRICALWNDLNVIVANGANVYIDSTPARCTITWDRAVNFGMTTQFQMQVQLLPSGEVTMFWSEGATNNSTYNFAAGSGITGVSPGGGVAVTTAVDLSAFGQTADDLMFEHWTTQGTFDLPLRSLQLVPTSPGWLWLPLPWVGCAETADYGTGCISALDSFYEIMPPNAVDLAGRTITLLRGANGYTMTTAIVGTYVSPGLAAATIANADDIVQTVTLSQAMPVPGGATSQLAVSSNGNIALSGTGNGNGFAPDVGNFLNFAQTVIAPAWHDYNPAIGGSGSIVFEQVGGTAYVTWKDVYSYASTLPDRFQCQFDLASGNITIVYETFSMGSSSYLFGYSRGGPSPAVEESDLSALAVPIVLADNAVQGLTMKGNSLPLIGNLAFSYGVSQVPNVVPIGVVLFGDQAVPGLDLGFLGMPGCRVYTNASLTSVTYVAALPAGTATVPLAIPNSLGLVGASLTAQALAFTLATPLNLVSSNGTLITLGL